MLAEALGLRQSEVRRVLPLTAAYGLVMAALYVLKPARNAMFLQRFSVDQLPVAMLLVAVMGALASLVYARFSARASMQRTVLWVFGLFMVSLLVFRVLLPLNLDWVVYLFYIWVALYSLVATSLLWQLANAEFNAREARRLFGIIGTGGIGGAVVGAFLTGRAVKHVGTENMLFVAIGMLLLATLATRMGAGRGDSRPQTRRPDLEGEDSGSLELIRRSPLLGSFAVMGALIAVVAVIVDVQFNHIVEQTYPDQDEKAAFFGNFFAALNVLAILVQTLATPRILTRFGVGVGLFVLPFALLGATGLALMPALWTGIMPKIADGLFRHSVHRASSEILFIPVPRRVTKRVKLFLDAAVDSMATGLGALLVLGLTQVVGVSYYGLSFISSGLIALWLLLTVRLRRAYVDAFRDALARRLLDVDELRTNISDAGTVDALIAALQGGQVRRVQFALETLVSAQDERIPGQLEPLLKHTSPGIRARALKGLLSQRREPMIDQVRPLLQDPDHRVRVQAVHYLALYGGRQPEDVLRGLLQDEDINTRAAAVGCIAEYGSSDERGLVDSALVDEILAMPSEETEQVRVHLAKLLGSGAGAELGSYWHALMGDPSDRVVRQTMDSVGRIKNHELAGWLFDLLNDTRYRMDARLALAAFGEEMLDTIAARLADHQTPERVRLILPRILARIPSQRSVDILLKAAEGTHGDEKSSIISALLKLRMRFAELRFDDPAVDDLLRVQVRAYYVYYRMGAALLPLGKFTAGRLLLKTLQQKRTLGLERVFQILAMRYPPKDIMAAYRALLSEKSDRTASAIEFLDNVLERQLKSRILPMFDPDAATATESTATLLVGREFADPAEALEELMGSPDPWLRASALFAAREARPPVFAQWAAALAQDANEVVRETAALPPLAPAQAQV